MLLILHFKLLFLYLRFLALYFSYTKDITIMRYVKIRIKSNKFRASNVMDYILILFYHQMVKYLPYKQYIKLLHKNDSFNVLQYTIHIYHIIYVIFNSYLNDIHHVFNNEKWVLLLNHKVIIFYILYTKN